LIGTKTDFDGEDVVLFIEDDDEYLYNIDRMLLHLRRSGKLSRLAGLVIGRMTNLKDNVVPFGYSVDEIAAYHCRDYEFPIVSGFPFGHGGSQVSVPLGISIQLSAEVGGQVYFSLEESAVTS
jgi:muramoyltetrapeptide carboxypeptidase